MNRKKNNFPSLEKKRARLAWILVAPTFLYLIAILIVPLGWSLNLSFTDKLVGGPIHYIGLDNYIKLLTDSAFLGALKNTLVFTVLAIFGKVVFGVALAMILNMNFKGRNLVRALLIIPWTLPNIVSILNWKWMFDDVGGVLNQILKMLGLIETNVVWIGTPVLAMLVIIVVNVWRGTPFIGISVLSKLQTISPDYYEAACIDGASAFQKFRYITIPAISDVLTVSALVSTIWTINEFELVWILTGGGPSRATELLSIFSYKTVVSSREIGLSAAVPFILMPVLIFLISRISKLRNETL